MLYGRQHEATQWPAPPRPSDVPRTRRAAAPVGPVSPPIGRVPPDELARFELDILSPSLLRNLEAGEVLNELSRDLRLVYELRLREGCSYRQIATALDVPLGTVQSRLHRARARLRELLHDAAEEGRRAA